MKRFVSWLIAQCICSGTNAPICARSHKVLQNVSRRVSFHLFLSPVLMYFWAHKMCHGLELYSFWVSSFSVSWCGFLHLTDGNRHPLRLFQVGWISGVVQAVCSGWSRILHFTKGSKVRWDKFGHKCSAWRGSPSNTRKCKPRYTLIYSKDKFGMSLNDEFKEIKIGAEILFLYFRLLGKCGITFLL